MTQTKIFGNGVTFCQVHLFGQYCQRYRPINGFKMLFDHQNLCIDTSYVEISVILVKK